MTDSECRQCRQRHLACHQLIGDDRHLRLTTFNGFAWVGGSVVATIAGDGFPAQSVATVKWPGTRAGVLHDNSRTLVVRVSVAASRRLVVGELDVNGEFVAVEVRKGRNRAGRREVAFGGGEGADEVRRGAHHHARDRGALGDLGR